MRVLPISGVEKFRSDELLASQQDELRNDGEIPAPQSSRFRDKPEKPLEAGALHPGGRLGL